MKYLVTVSDDNVSIERIIFSYCDEAIMFAERRRKQGYFVTITTIK